MNGLHRQEKVISPTVQQETSTTKYTPDGDIGRPYVLSSRTSSPVAKKERQPGQEGEYAP